MSLVGAVVVFAVTWFLIFLVILPRGAATQDETGSIEPGTPAGAPAEINIGRKAMWTTISTAVVVAVVAIVLGQGLITLDDFDFLYPDSYWTPGQPR